MYQKILINNVEEYNKLRAIMEDKRVNGRWGNRDHMHYNGSFPVMFLYRTFEHYVIVKQDYTDVMADEDIELVAFDAPNLFFDYPSLTRFVSPDSSWDYPFAGKAVLYFPMKDDPSINLLLDAGIISINQRDPNRPYEASKYVVDQMSTHYDAYKYYDKCIYGAKLWDGTYSWKQLKLHTFLHHRIPDNTIIQELMDELDKVAPRFSEDYFTIEESLVRGYNNTEIDSCMQGNGEFYENFEDAGVLLKYDDQQYIGRAVIWSDQYVSGLPEGCQGLMDRIYPSGNHKVVEAYKKYADMHNLAYKNYQSYDEKRSIIWKSQMISNSELILSPPNAGTNKIYPYMDTFTYTDDFRTFGNYSGYASVALTDTQGGHSDSRDCCCCDNTIRDDDDCVDAEGSHYCPDCFEEHTRTCEHCDELFHYENIHPTEDGYVCSSCISSAGYVYCRDIGNYSRDYVKTYDTDRYYYRATELYYTQDTHRYFEYSRNLYLHNNLYYEEEQNDQRVS